MSENTNENTTEELQDVEAHRVRQAPVDDRVKSGGGAGAVEDEDVEGHRVRQAPVDERVKSGGGGGLVEDEDVEGHAVRQAPADDVSDDGIDFERPR
jgi:hypothetical protein